MTNKQSLREAAEITIGILENIAGFETSDIDGDTVELRFETDGGLDTGCDVSIVDQCQKAADVVRALLDELEAKDKRIAALEAEQSALRPVGVMSEKAFHRLEGSESRFIALWPRPGIYLPRKRPEDGVIVYARTADRINGED